MDTDKKNILAGFSIGAATVGVLALLAKKMFTASERVELTFKDAPTGDVKKILV